MTQGNTMAKQILPHSLPGFSILFVLLVSVFVPSQMVADAVANDAVDQKAGADSDDSDSKAGSEQPATATAISEADLKWVQEKVQPLIQSRCGECHSLKDGAAPASLKGGLSLVSRQSILRGGDSGPAIVPFHPEQSLMISAVRYESFEMPPRSRLPEEEIRILEKWIQLGAPWPQSELPSDLTSEKEEFPLAARKAAHWAWKPISSPKVPVIDSPWAETPIDSFVLSGLKNSGLEPAADADRRTLIRRLYFDLTGLPPTVEQQEKFFNDPSDTQSAISELADQLLQSPHFGERWARHWLDLVRYAETLGHEFDYPLPYAWQYRDYVIRALNMDVPYNQFVTEHVAGDLLAEPRRHPELGFNESIIGTGFWYLSEDKHAPVDVKGEEAARIDNQIDVFSKTFLGLTVACARCHDHKFDAITAQDYYALSGYLQSSRRRTDWLTPQRKIDDALNTLQTVRADLKQQLRKDLNLWTAEKLAAVTSICLDSMLSSQASSDTLKELSSTASRMKAQLATETSLHPDNLLSFPAELAKSWKAAATGQPDSENLLNTVRQWSQRIQEAADADKAQSDPVFADFRDGLPDGWLVYGDAFSHLKNSAKRDISAGISWSNQGLTVTASDSLSSAELAPELRGTLHSPTFELTTPEILVEVAGKNSGMRLVIDGYVMNEFSELLFHGARQAIETDGEFRWIRLAGDVHRYQGHRCHLELTDNGNGWFNVRQIRFVSRPGSGEPAYDRAIETNLQIAKKLSDLCEKLKTQTSEDDGPSLSEMLMLWSTTVLSDPQWPAAALLFDAFPFIDSADFQDIRQRWKDAALQIPDGFPVLVMCDGSPEDEHLFIRGSHKNPGSLVPRRFLSALTDEKDSPAAKDSSAATGSGRMALAEKLVAEDNPFVARVIVNRVWQHLMGTGIVPSVDNFGVLGELPSHPELLDYLADEFRNDGWSIHRLIRRIVLSRTYRMSSNRSEMAETLDPTNRLYHRANFRRLEGEIIRDAMLMVSGRLQPKMYGPPVPVYLTSFMQGRGRPGKGGPLDGDGRRSIYQSVNRNFLSPFMLAFDTPIPATAVGRRSVSNVPAQALILLNNEFVSQQAAVWAEKLVAEEHSSLESLLNAAYRQAFCRHPTMQEVADISEFTFVVADERNIARQEVAVSRELVTDICHVLLNQKEFLFLE